MFRHQKFLLPGGLASLNIDMPFAFCRIKASDAAQGSISRWRVGNNLANGAFMELDVGALNHLRGVMSRQPRRVPMLSKLAPE